MHVVVTEELSRGVLDRYSDLFASADACIAVWAVDGEVVLEALQSARWRVGDIPLSDEVDMSLARAAREVVGAQSRVGPLTNFERGMLTYGLETRLRPAAYAHRMVQRLCSETGVALDSLRLDVITDDAYLRDVFLRLRAGPRNVRIHPKASRSSLVPDVRARLTRSHLLRKLDLAIACPEDRPPTSGAKSLDLFVFNQRSIDLFRPVRVELERRKWHVRMFSYPRLADRGSDVIGFQRASRSVRGRVNVIPGRRWVLDSKLLDELPIPASSLATCLEVSWVTGMVQMERHRRVLDLWRPDVVASFGPDIMTLALQAAADQLKIPSILLAHCFFTPEPVTWFVHGTATAVFGAGCLQVNRVNALGERQDGLVMTGHPDFDAILRAERAGCSGLVRELQIPASRPHVILFFAEWSRTLLGHIVLRRTLDMIARALPDDAFLLCKLHPGREERGMCEEILGRTLDQAAFRVIGSRCFTAPQLLQAARVAIGVEHSMAIADAVVAGVPSIAIRNPEFPISAQSLSHPAQDYRRVSRIASDLSELRTSIGLLLHDEAERNRLISCRQAYIDKFLLAADGQSARRVADLAEHLAAGNAPETFVPVTGPSLIS